MLIRAAAKTDIGKVRRENQDAFGLFRDDALFVVADGIGGHAGGRTASTLAVQAIERSVESTRDADLTPVTEVSGASSADSRRLTIAVHAADDAVRDAARSNPDLAGMGTTVAAVLFDARAALVAVCHTGDSRVYRVRGDCVEQLTEDHTVAQELLKAGHLTAGDVATSPHRHVLTQALGMEEQVRPDLRLDPYLAGDVFILTSDGVHGVVGPDEMLAILGAAGPDLDAACTRLIDLSNERGGRDNSTVVIVACGGQAGSTPKLGR